MALWNLNHQFQRFASYSSSSSCIDSMYALAGESRRWLGFSIKPKGTAATQPVGIRLDIVGGLFKAVAYRLYT